MKCDAQQPPSPGMVSTVEDHASNLRGRAVLLLVVLLAASTMGAGKIPTGQTITEIRIEGNETIPEHQIRGKLNSRPGRPFDPDIITRDYHNLNNTKWFSHVGSGYLDDPDRGGIILVFKVEEMPVLRVVEFRGRQALSVKVLEENTGLKPGARADHVRTMAAVAMIRRLYEEKGYLLAEVELIEGGKPGDRAAVFQIFEGPRFRVGAIEFEGNTVFTSATLKTKIQTRPPILGLLGGHYFKDTPEDDARSIVEAYQKIGYFECQCTPVVRPGKNLGDIRVTFVISEGPLYKVRSISFEGQEKLTEEELREGMVLHSGEALRDDVRQRDANSLMAKYSRIGCIDAIITPEPRFADEQGVVDLIYRIEEGDQYLLADINVRGNERTRAKVVLRELAAAGLLPGQPLDGTRIDTAKKRLGALQYFHTNPEMGQPIEIKIVNRRDAEQRYGTVAPIDMSEIIQARFQGPEFDESDFPEVFPPSPDDGPPIPEDLPPLEPFDPGAGFGSGGAFVAPPDVVPSIPVPSPPPQRRGILGNLFGGGPAPDPAYPPASASPPGTLPNTPGMNLNDVGPDRQEPFPNRGIADIITQAEPRGRAFADLDVGVDEAPTGRLLFGVGASSFSGLNGTFIVHERNFDLFNVPRSFREVLNGQAFRGGGQEFRLELSPGTQINRALVSFREPALFDLPIGLNVSGYAFNRLYPDFNEARGGGRFALGRQFFPQVYADVAFRVEDVRVDGFRSPAPADFLAVSGNTFLTTIRPSIYFDTRNDPFLPSEGSYLEGGFEQGWGTFTYPKFTTEGRQHFTLRSRPDLTGKHILTFRGFFGISGRDTPMYERFFAGDFRSMRGFAFRGVGPHIMGANVGGIFSTIGSVEYQFPITANDRIQWVVFSDFGSVENTYSIRDFRVAVGTGIRLTIPALGPLPLAFDVAWPIVKAEGDRTRPFTFFIGAFW